MALTQQEMANRVEMWEKANEMIGPLVDEHGFEKVTIGGFLNTVDVITPVDLHINSIIRVADWLLGKDY